MLVRSWSRSIGSSDSSYLDVVDPDHVSVIQGDGITTPDVVRVEVGDVDVLDDDVLRARDNSQTLALDNTSAAAADQRLVGLDSDAQKTGIVVGDGGLGGAGLVVVTPRVLVDGQLAGGSSTPRSTAGRGGSTLSAGEVEGLGQDNDTGGVITKVRDQLGGGGRVDGSSRATTGNTLGETLGGTRDGHGRDGVGKQRCCRSKRTSESHIDDIVIINIIIFG
jgi:hypothetical protein